MLLAPLSSWMTGLGTVAAVVAAGAATYAARQSAKAARSAVAQAEMQERHHEEMRSGAKLQIHCHEVAGKLDEDDERVYVKFRVQNTTSHHPVRNCRAYLTEMYKVSNNALISENLTPDTFQLCWAGYDFTPRDIPAGVAQYVDLVHFSKVTPGWKFRTRPDFYVSLTKHTEHRGTFRFTVMVAGEGALPQTKHIFVDYNGDWRSAAPYELPSA